MSSTQLLFTMCMRCVDGRKERKERRKEEKDFAACTLIFVKVRKPYGLRNLVEKVFLFCFFSFFFFLSFLILFFQLEGRLAGLRLAHICCSSLLAFNTTQAQLPPRRGGKEKDRGWERKFSSDIKALLHWIKTAWNNRGRVKGCLVRMGERKGTVGWWEEGIRMNLWWKIAKEVQDIQWGPKMLDYIFFCFHF